jgi:DNA polymerase-3 subunit delta
MRIDSVRLDTTAASLAPVTLVFGDELLLVEEAADKLRQAATGQGYTERVKHTVERGFDWAVLYAAGQSMSLFSERRLIELRLPTGKPGTEGSKMLCELLDHPPEDTIFFIISGRIEAQAQKQKWFRAIEKQGLVVEGKAVKLAALPAWLGARLSHRGLQADRDSIALLMHYFEGNLLAAAQEIDRLALRMGDAQAGDVSQVEALRQSVSDNTRFSVFNYIDACLEGNRQRTLRMLDGIHGEGEGAALVLWALAREARNLTRIAWELAQGSRQSEVFARYRIWSSRQPFVAAAVRRHGYPGWRGILRKVARLDQIMKGRASGEGRDVWFDIERLSLQICGWETTGALERTP